MKRLAIKEKLLQEYDIIGMKKKKSHFNSVERL